MRIARPYFEAVFLALGVFILASGIVIGIVGTLEALDGVEVTGTVVSKDIEHNYGTNSSTPQDVYHVHYTFVPPDESVVQGDAAVDPAAWSGLTVGGPIPVFYVRMAPALIHGYGPLGHDNLLGALGVISLVMGTGLAFALAGGWATWIFLREIRSRRDLMAHGVATMGTILNNAGNGVQIRGSFQRRLRYQYRDQTGHKRTGLSSYITRAVAAYYEVGSTGIVRYKPDRQGVSDWFGEEDPAAPLPSPAVELPRPPDSAANPSATHSR